MTFPKTRNILKIHLYSETNNMEKVNEQQQPKTSSNNDQKRNEIWKVLNEARFPHDRHDYNGSFDDGNHPGDSTEHRVRERGEEEK